MHMRTSGELDSMQQGAAVQEEVEEEGMDDEAIGRRHSLEEEHDLEERVAGTGSTGGSPRPKVFHRPSVASLPPHPGSTSRAPASSLR